MAIQIKGLSIQDILTIPAQNINKMNRKELSAIASRLVSASNKRIRRLEKASGGKTSPSYLAYKRNRGGKQFSVKNKDVNAIRNEIKQMKNFLNQKTSTVTGWKKVKKNIEKRIGKMNRKQTKKFWEVYHKIEETEGGLIQIIHDSSRIQQMLHQEIIDDNEDAFETMMNNLDVLYDEIYDGYENDLDDVFTLSENI